MADRIVLASLVRKRGFTLPTLSAACREHEGGQGMGITQICAYLRGKRPIGSRHFAILCLVLKADQKDVYTSLYLAGGGNEAIII